MVISLVTTSVSYAQPYGKGIYNEIVPYGNQTSLSISTSGDINIPITPTTNGTLGTANSVVTVTSTDVKGYKLYIRSLNHSYMENFGAQIPTQPSQFTGELLSANSLGYNADGLSLIHI